MSGNCRGIMISPKCMNPVSVKPGLGHWQTVDPDQTPQSAASDQGLHCLLKLQEVKDYLKRSYVPVQGHFSRIDPPGLSAL